MSSDAVTVGGVSPGGSRIPSKPIHRGSPVASAAAASAAAAAATASADARASRRTSSPSPSPASMAGMARGSILEGVSPAPRLSPFTQCTGEKAALAGGEAAAAPVARAAAPAATAAAPRRGSAGHRRSSGAPDAPQESAQRAEVEWTGGAEGKGCGGGAEGEWGDDATEARDNGHAPAAAATDESTAAEANAEADVPTDDATMRRGSDSIVQDTDANALRKQQPGAAKAKVPRLNLSAQSSCGSGNISGGGGGGGSAKGSGGRTGAGVRGTEGGLVTPVGNKRGAQHHATLGPHASGTPMAPSSPSPLQTLAGASASRIPVSPCAGGNGSCSKGSADRVPRARRASVASYGACGGSGDSTPPDRVAPRVAFGRAIMGSPGPRRPAAAASRIAKPAGETESVCQPQPQKAAVPMRSESAQKTRPAATTAPSGVLRSVSVDKTRPAGSAAAAQRGPRAAAAAAASEERAAAAARRARAAASPARATAASGEQVARKLSGAGAQGTSILSAIPERAKPQGGKPVPPALAATKPASPRIAIVARTTAARKTVALRPASTAVARASSPAAFRAPTAAPAAVAPTAPKPVLSLNLSAVQPRAAGMGVPVPPAGTPPARAHSALTDASDPSPPPQTVPKLNLTPVLQQRDDEIGDAPAYKVAHSSGKGGVSGSQPSTDPVDHFYYYPKLDSKTERQTMDIIENMPKKEREHMKQIFQSMVEARQNCEAIAFRGHRLLDQLNSHMREQVCTERGEKTELQTQLAEYQKRVQEQECQLASLKMILQGMQGLSQSGVLGHVGGMLSSLGVDVTGAGASGGDGAAGSGGGEVSQAEQDLLRDINALSSEMTSVRNTVNHLSSRLGGVVAPPGSGLSAALLGGGGGAAAHGLGWPEAGGDTHWTRDQPLPEHQQQRPGVGDGSVLPTAAADGAPRPVPVLNLATVKPLPAAAVGEDDCARVLDVDR